MDARRHATACDSRGRLRSGLTILELLVAMGMISVLSALLLPAISAAREAARRVECTNHFRQVGIALHNYHDVHTSLPAAWQWDRTGKTAFSWSVPLLPFVEQQPLANSIDRALSVADARLDAARAMSLKVFRCPSDVSPRMFTLTDEDGEPVSETEYPAANLVGVYGTTEPDDVRPTPPGDGTFINARPVRFSEFTRGLSCTFVVGERSVSMLPSTWFGFDDRDEDAQCRIVGEAYRGPNCQSCDECEFSSRHSGVSQFLWGDGHVQSVSDSVDVIVYRQMARRSD